MDDKPLIAFEQVHEVDGIGPADFQHAIELLELLQADSPGEFERPHVVAGDDESVRLKKRVVVPLSKSFDRRFSRNVPCPAVIANRPGAMPLKTPVNPGQLTVAKFPAGAFSKCMIFVKRASALPWLHQSRLRAWTMWPSGCS